MTFPEENFGRTGRIRLNKDMSIWGTTCVVLKFDIVVQNNINEHRFNLIRREEPTVATPNKNVLLLLSCYKNTDLPCMFPVSKGKILWRWTNKLIFHPFGAGDLVTFL